MILLDEVYSLFEWLAEQNTYIQHNASGTPSQRRFARYKSEALTGQHSTLGSPRLEVCELPYGDLTDGLGWERDRAVFELRVIYNVEKYKVTETTTALDNAKKALIELFNYLFSAQSECTDCNQLLCLFNLSTVKYSWLDKATLGGDWVGCRATFELRRNIDWDNVTYGPRPDYTTTAFNTWLHGNGVPANTLGIDGDFYIVDDDTDAPYYRKVNGAWVFQRNLAGSGGSITETDPVFAASPAHGITNTNITNWNAAYGWGNHAGLYSLLGHTHTIGDIDINDDVDFNGNKGINVADPVDDYDAVNKKTLDAAISETNVYDLQGSLDCSTNPNFPPAVKGMRWEVNVPGKIGGAGGIDVEEWDEVVCIVDNAGGDFATVGSSWYVVKSRVLQAEEDYSGTAELATNAETQAGTDDMRIVTPLKLAGWWAYVKGLAQTFAQKITFTLAPRFSSVTANHVLTVDSNKDLSSEAKGTAFNKDFGTGTTNVPAIGSTLGNSLPVVTNSSGQLTTTSLIPADNGGANDWVDYTASSTVTGWGSFVYKSIWYQKRYKCIDVRVYVSGTSNSNAATITLPFSLKSAITPEQMMICRIVNNGAGASGRCYISSGSNVLVFNATIDGANFASIGSKAVYLDFTLPID